MINALKNKILNNGEITKAEAMALADAPLDGLTAAADEIRRHFCGDSFDLCSIINAKCGRCSEDCRYCAQSAGYAAELDTYPLISADEAAKQAKINEENGILRFDMRLVRTFNGGAIPPSVRRRTSART